MASPPSSPLTWTAIPAADASVGPGIAYAAASSGTLITVPGVSGAFAVSGTEITPNVSEIDWQVIESDDASVMGPILFGSFASTVALYFYGSTLAIIEGA